VSPSPRLATVARHREVRRLSWRSTERIPRGGRDGVVSAMGDTDNPDLATAITTIGPRGWTSASHQAHQRPLVAWPSGPGRHRPSR
jgi:hypothetical protein